jgi:hypothetical protein
MAELTPHRLIWRIIRSGSRGDGHHAEIVENTHGDHVFLDALAEPADADSIEHGVQDQVNVAQSQRSRTQLCACRSSGVAGIRR